MTKALRQVLQSRRWRASHPEHREYIREYQRRRYNTDPEYRAAQCAYKRKRYADPEKKAELCERQCEYEHKRGADPEKHASRIQYYKERRVIN